MDPLNQTTATKIAQVKRSVEVVKGLLVMPWKIFHDEETAREFFLKNLELIQHLYSTSSLTPEQKSEVDSLYAKLLSIKHSLKIKVMSWKPRP